MKAVCKYVWAFVLTLLCSSSIVSAQSADQKSLHDTDDTPIERLIIKYAAIKGSRDFIASGNQIILARSLIKRTNLAPIAAEVNVLEVLKMQNAEPNEIQAFEKDLKSALTTYKYYGKADSKNGKVDVYFTQNSKGNIDELVIYNPENQTLNSLKGDISPALVQSVNQME